MAEFRKYKMSSPQDYRPNIEKHEVRLVRVVDGEDWALGKFTNIDEDMVDLTEEEIASLPKTKIPTISLRQAREALIEKGLFDNVESILASVEDPKEKKILTNYWEYSQEFQRDHKLLGLITQALGMTDDEVDEFFLFAYSL